MINELKKFLVHLQFERKLSKSSQNNLFLVDKMLNNFENGESFFQSTVDDMISEKKIIEFFL